MINRGLRSGLIPASLATFMIVSGQPSSAERFLVSTPPRSCAEAISHLNEVISQESQLAKEAGWVCGNPQRGAEEGVRLACAEDSRLSAVTLSAK